MTKEGYSLRKTFAAAVTVCSMSATMCAVENLAALRRPLSVLALGLAAGPVPWIH